MTDDAPQAISEERHGSTPSVTAEPSTGRRDRRPPGGARSGGLGRMVPWLLGLLALVGLGATLLPRWLAVDEPPELSVDAPGRFAVLPFQVEGGAGDAWIRLGLSSLVSEALARTRGVGVVSSDRLGTALGRRRVGTDDPEERRRARELASALGGQTIVDGVFRRDGDRAVLDVELFDPGDRSLASVRFSGADPMAAADQLVIALGRLGDGAVEPVSLRAAFSHDAFADRLYASGLARLRAPGTPKERAGAARPYFDIALAESKSFATARARLVECLLDLGELDAARTRVEELLEASQSLGRQDLLAQGHRSIGRLEAIAGNHAAAEQQFEQAHRIYLGLRDVGGQTAALYERARLELAQGRPQRAEELFVEVLQLQKSMGDRIGEIDTQVRLGSLMLASGDLEPAGQVFEEALSQARGLRDPWSENRISASLGEVTWRLGDAENARVHWGRALAFYRQQGDRSRVLLLSRNLARALLDAGDLEAAEDLYQDQLDLAKEQRDPRAEADAALKLAWLQLRLGYPFQARDYLDRALELDRHLDDRRTLQQVIAWQAYENGSYDLAISTQVEIKKRYPDAWTEEDQGFLDAFFAAREAGRRLPLPTEGPGAGTVAG